MNRLFYGDNLDVLKQSVQADSGSSASEG